MAPGRRQLGELDVRAQLEDYDNAFTWAKWVTPSRDLIKAYTDEGDVTRLEETVVYYSCGWSNYYPASHYAFMYKLRSGYNNEYVVRLADIILLEAEAYAAKGDTQNSAKLVNMIRRRAKLADLTADKTASKDRMLEAVLHERRLELAMEGERWYDLCRYGKVEEVINSLAGRDAGRLPLVRQFDKNLYLMPIPQSALDENQNLQQNLGY
ncbi:RagB/SusD family nutrient uptake outer membrane protein [Segatella baroniae]|uniref:RagB/SusD family nutrient uptake outer membrane protein n=1 Tax=Segatella baroniae TaxID=305719 RepID=UPI00277D0877|nr:RagB/SusD family nutrient uptake outer membrane protein [Segatella baroniae]